ncbi:MAG: hypothetical protein AAF236_07630 [Verrucomicrobiota bacterium]
MQLVQFVSLSLRSGAVSNGYDALDQPRRQGENMESKQIYYNFNTLNPIQFYPEKE